MGKSIICKREVFDESQLKYGDAIHITVNIDEHKESVKLPLEFYALVGRIEADSIHYRYMGNCGMAYDGKMSLEDYKNGLYKITLLDKEKGTKLEG